MSGKDPEALKLFEGKKKFFSTTVCLSPFAISCFCPLSMMALKVLGFFEWKSMASVVPVVEERERRLPHYLRESSHGEKKAFFPRLSGLLL